MDDNNDGDDDDEGKERKQIIKLSWAEKERRNFMMGPEKRGTETEKEWSKKVVHSSRRLEHLRTIASEEFSMAMQPVKVKKSRMYPVTV